MKKDIPTIHINMDAKCKRCGKGGATQGGYCLKCILAKLKKGDYDHILKPQNNVSYREDR